jgi:hypothetical protein
MMNFYQLLDHEKKKFNTLLNNYIASLPEDWKHKLLTDFHKICNEEIFHEKFDVLKFQPLLIDSDIHLLPKEDEATTLGI